MKSNDEYDERRSRAPELVKRALLVEKLSTAWMIVEAAVGLVAGIAGHAVSLVVFGLNSVLELIAGGAVYVQLRGKSLGETSPHSEERERKALWAVGLTLWLLCVYVIVNALLALLHHRVPEKTLAGLAVALAALIITPLLASAKLRLGREIPNRALVADAKETMACGWLSIVVVFGVGLYTSLGWWWADSAAALAMIPFLVREGRNAIRFARGK
jgi:divalent metal cation (Fe/Co/Zn/Cd) transporter